MNMEIMQHPLSRSMCDEEGVFRHELRLVQKGLFAVAVCEFGYTEQANFRRVHASLLAWGLPDNTPRVMRRDFKLRERAQRRMDGAIMRRRAHSLWHRTREREICRAFPRNDSICFYWIRLSVANCVNTADALLWRRVATYIKLWVVFNTSASNCDLRSFPCAGVYNKEPKKN
jgi:hypothetical protein